MKTKTVVIFVILLLGAWYCAVIWTIVQKHHVSNTALNTWGYHREGDAIVINNDLLTIHADGSVTDTHGDFVGKIQIVAP